MKEERSMGKKLETSGYTHHTVFPYHVFKGKYHLVGIIK